MARKQSIQPGRFCRECEHYYACSAQCGGLLYNTDATHCANFANISAYQEEIERLRLVVDEQDLALQKTENDLNTSRQAKWISVEERLPEVDKLWTDKDTNNGYKYSADLLVYDGVRIRVAYYCHTTTWWYDSRYEDDIIEVTHWMPLPSTEGLHDN